MNTEKRLGEVEKEIKANAGRLKTLREERAAAKTPRVPQDTPRPLLSAEGIKPRSFILVAQGDSWFDYPTSWDLIDWLQFFGHEIGSGSNIAVAGSTLNDIVYGRVPKNHFGIPQSDEISRWAELIDLIERKRPQGVLLSGGGNDIAGPEFFSFVNNASSRLGNPNQEVLDGVVNKTFTKAYTDLISLILEKADRMGMPEMKVFLHGYDYPFPDGRGFSVFDIVGPWFHDTLNKKNYPYDPDGKDAVVQLTERRNIVKTFIDSFNTMLSSLSAQAFFVGRVTYVDLRDTLPSHNDWANELHPTREGFHKLAAKIDFILHKVLS